MAAHTRINQDRKLFKKAQRGDLQARNTIAVANLPLVRKLAKAYFRAECAYEDLVQVGSLGLMRAIKTYNPDLSAFSTYASKWIRNFITMEIRNAGVVHGPVNTTPAALQRRLDAIPLDDHKHRDAVRIMILACDRCASMDVEISEEDGCRTWAEAVPDPQPLPDEQASDREREKAAQEAITRLDARLQRIIRRRSREDTLNQIGDQFGVTRERIRQLAVRAEQRLAARLERFRDTT